MNGDDKIEPVNKENTKILKNQKDIHVRRMLCTK